MRVAVDGRALRPGAVHERGVAGYLRWLLEALGELAPDDEYVVIVPSLADPEPLRAANVRLLRRRVPSQLLFGAVPLLGRPRLDRLAAGCDVAWAPAPRPVAVSAEVNYVLTLHDLAFEHRPSDFSAYERAWHRLARTHRLAQAATRVICVSGPVRDEAVVRWRLDPEQTRVVAHGPGRPPGPAGALPAGLADGFVLAVGALEPRKRPELLIEGHRRARERGLAAGLVFAGDGPLRGELERTHATVLGHVAAPLLESLYAKRACAGVRLARGGLWLHAGRGDCARHAGGRRRPAGLRRDARPGRAASRPRRRGRARRGPARAGALPGPA